MRSLVIGLVTLGILKSVQVSWAEDPVVVVYDDPSLTRLEKEIGVTPGQKDRFDDIVVKYRDPQASNDGSASTGADADLGSGKQSGGRGGGGGGRGHGGGGGRGGSAFTGAKGDNLRQELDELATVLTPAQLQKFKDLSKHKKKPEHGASQSPVGMSSCSSGIVGNGIVATADPDEQELIPTGLSRQFAFPRVTADAPSCEQPSRSMTMSTLK